MQLLPLIDRQHQNAAELHPGVEPGYVQSAYSECWLYEKWKI